MQNDTQPKVSALEKTGLVKVGGIVMTKAEAAALGASAAKGGLSGSAGLKAAKAAPSPATVAKEARAGERKRLTAVFASDASRGRERAAARLLADNGTASEIIAALAAMPTDAEAALQVKAKREAAAAAVWDQVQMGGR